MTVLIGTWQAWPVAVPVTVAGMVLVAVFTLRALKRSFFGDDDAVAEAPSLPPVTLPEKVGAIILMLATLIVGVFPGLILDRILPAIERMNLVIPPAP